MSADETIARLAGMDCNRAWEREWRLAGWTVDGEEHHDKRREW